MFPFASAFELVSQENAHVDISGELALESARSHCGFVTFFDRRLLEIDEASKRNLGSHEVIAVPQLGW